MIATAADIAALRAETNTKIEGIKNTTSITTSTSRKYYVSSSEGSDTNNGTSSSTPFKTLSKLNSVIASKSNVTVYLKRGDVWRGEQIVTEKDNITITAYGEGAKPVLMGSPENGGGSTNASKWTDMGNNIWRYEGSQNWADVGNIVFNDGDSYAKKIVQLYVKQEGWANYALTDFTNAPAQKYTFKSYKDLANDLDFYHDKDFDGGDGSSGATGYLYMYSTSNPALRFESIEFSVKIELITAYSVDDVTVDNLCFKYTGGHAVHGSGQPNESTWSDTDLKNFTVQNCEFYWIGGSIQDRINQDVIGTVPPNNWVADVRYGNAIEVYGQVNGFIARNNYIYEVFDAGITVQKTVGDSSKDWSQKNIQFIDNVIENCNYSIEYFLTSIPSGNSSKMENFVISGNYMWNAGVGFCSTRPVWDQGFAAHIKSQKSTPCNNATGFEITDNVMVGIGSSFLLIRSSFGESSLPLFEGNTLYGYYDFDGTAADGFQIGVVSGNTDGKEKEESYDAKVDEYLAEQFGSQYGEGNKYYFIF